jgi:hypothetical protein
MGTGDYFEKGIPRDKTEIEYSAGRAWKWTNTCTWIAKLKEVNPYKLADLIICCFML